MSAKPQAPCGKVCDSRAPACQTTCERWKAYEGEREAYYREQKRLHAVAEIEYDLRAREDRRIMQRLKRRK